MKSKLVFSTVAVMTSLMGCGAPTRPPASTGGATSTGGTSASGGSVADTGGTKNGGATNSGGAVGQGGNTDATGGTSTGSGGATGSGGSTKTGGVTSSGGATATGGATGSGGATATGGATGSGGAAVTGGTAAGTGGTVATGGSSGVTGPCDIYQAASTPTPCVAAHSTVRALYGSYAGALYQLRRKSDGTLKDVPVKAPGGFVDIAVQNTFCAGTTCTISILYDQSPKKNDLKKAPVAVWLKSGANEANAALAEIKVGGNTVHGIYVDNGNNPATDVGYRNNDAVGLATGDEPQTIYMVLDGTRYSGICCFDYGNAGKSGTDEGKSTMEAIYWGNSTLWSKGGGPGPWVSADLEVGMYQGDSTNTPSNTSVTGMSYVTAMLKGYPGDKMGLKAGNAQSGKLETKWDGKRPPGYSPMKKVGAIILGTGGDGSSYGKGTYFEGCITTGVATNETDELIQANIVAAGYGK